ncbi:DMT family transporter [Breoghania sp. L-A4]|nr:DMT family transporter [Breoghania sp. L-A4]
MTPASWVLLILLSGLWGGSFFFTKIAVAEIPALTLTLARVAIAALALHLVLRLRRIAFPWTRAALAPYVVMGLLNNAVPFTLLAWGQTHIASGLAAVLNAMTPISTVIIAHLLTDTDRATPQKLAGVLIGLGGVAVMIGPEALDGITENVTAQLACLAATVSYACAGIFGRRFRGQPALVTATGQLTGSSILMLPLVLIAGGATTLVPPSAHVAGSVLALALVSTAFAYILYFRILAQAGPTNVAMVTFLVPVSAIVLGAAFLGEVLEPRHWLGVALIAVALAAIDGRLLERLLERLRRTRLA